MEESRSFLKSIMGPLLQDIRMKKVISLLPSNVLAWFLRFLGVKCVRLVANLTYSCNLAYREAQEAGDRLVSEVGS